MRITFLYSGAVLLTILVGCHATHSTQTWTHQQAIEHFQNQHDSSKWDASLLAGDIEVMNSKSKDFMTFGAFPAPKYDLIGVGSFKGLGNYQGIAKVQDRDIVFNSFFIKRNTMNQTKLGDRPDDVFFLILTITDNLDTVKYAHSISHIISRNHPNYIGQGTFFGKKNKIDYLSFITADGNGYAVVNMKLFDLRLGKAIVIAPQIDGSFRSLQLPILDISSANITKTVDSLTKQNEVVKFITNAGNIK